MSLTFEQIKEMFPGDWASMSNETCIMYHPNNTYHSIHYNFDYDMWVVVIDMRMLININVKEVKKYYNRYWKFTNFE